MPNLGDKSVSSHNDDLIFRLFEAPKDQLIHESGYGARLTSLNRILTPTNYLPDQKPGFLLGWLKSTLKPEHDRDQPRVPSNDPPSQKNGEKKLLNINWNTTVTKTFTEVSTFTNRFI